MNDFEWFEYEAEKALEERMNQELDHAEMQVELMKDRSKEQDCETLVHLNVLLKLS